MPVDTRADPRDIAYVIDTRSLVASAASAACYYRGWWTVPMAGTD